MATLGPAIEQKGTLGPALPDTKQKKGLISRIATSPYVPNVIRPLPAPEPRDFTPTPKTGLAFRLTNGGSFNDPYFNPPVGSIPNKNNTQPLESPIPYGARPKSFNTQSFGKRADGSQKGLGFFGILARPDGKISSELSIGVNMDGKEIAIPSLVPTLNKDEINYLLKGGKPTPEIVRKAVMHARQRMSNGQSPFAQKGEQGNAPQGVLMRGNLSKVSRGNTFKGNTPGVLAKSALIDAIGATAKLGAVATSAISLNTVDYNRGTINYPLSNKVIGRFGPSLTQSNKALGVDPSVTNSPILPLVGDFIGLATPSGAFSGIEKGVNAGVNALENVLRSKSLFAEGTGIINKTFLGKTLPKIIDIVRPTLSGALYNAAYAGGNPKSKQTLLNKAVKGAILFGSFHLASSAARVVGKGLIDFAKFKKIKVSFSGQDIADMVSGKIPVAPEVAKVIGKMTIAEQNRFAAKAVRNLEGDVLVTKTRVLRRIWPRRATQGLPQPLKRSTRPLQMRLMQSGRNLRPRKGLRRRRHRLSMPPLRLVLLRKDHSKAPFSPRYRDPG